MVWLKSPTVEGNEFSWLTQDGSLTERLQKEFNDVKVDIIYEGLASEKEKDYIREVLIKSHGEPMIYAKTRLKVIDLEDAWVSLKTLGQQSLANILFKDPQIYRRSIFYRICESDDIFYRRLKSLGCIHEEILWVRQSEWEKNGKILSLTEAFLPKLFK